MIISHLHKFAFVAIPKTGTHAIRRAIRPHLGKYDWEHCRLFEKKDFPIATLAQVPHGHFTVMEIEPYFPKGTWETYFKFCFVRNPYDRFISFCNFYYPNEMQRDPKGTMFALFHNKKDVLDNHILLKPQYQFIYDQEMQLKADFIGKVEQFEKDFELLCNQLRIPFNKLNKANSSTGQKKVINTEIANYIYAHYEQDFDLFKYPKTFTAWQKN